MRWSSPFGTDSTLDGRFIGASLTREMNNRSGVCDTRCAMDAVAGPQSILEEPPRTLDPRAISAWRATTGAFALFGLAIVFVILVVLNQTETVTNLPLLIVLFFAGLMVAG